MWLFTLALSGGAAGYIAVFKAVTALVDQGVQLQLPREVYAFVSDVVLFSIIHGS